METFYILFICSAWMLLIILLAMWIFYWMFNRKVHDCKDFPLISLWIARDKSGSLFLYLFEPYKTDYDCGQWAARGVPQQLPSWFFPQVKWEDDEPTEVEITIKDTHK